METTSIKYLFFLAIVALGYYVLPKQHRVSILLAASFVFYYCNQKMYVLILIFSIALNYVLGYFYTKHKQKILIYLSIAFNVALLVFFKYIPIIIYGNKIPESSFWGRYLLPIGISFYSFQAIGYAIDLLWTDSEIVPIQHYALYMSFFPQLLSGPIARGKSFFPQLVREHSFNYENIVTGLRLILWGLMKKIVIANNLSPYTDAVYGNIAMHSQSTLCLSAVLYTVQLYVDFSAYTNIALGSAKMFGIHLIDNFNNPFRATSVTDFWRRWHISLSTWVRDYVNTPLQYLLRSFGMLGIMSATFITFLLIGVWHGASWNFVVFGVMQGAIITFEYFTKEWREKFWCALPVSLSSAVARVLVFVFFVFSFSLFRVPNLMQYSLFLKGIIKSKGVLYLGSSAFLRNAAIGGIIWLTVNVCKKDSHYSDFMKKLNLPVRWLIYISSIIVILLAGSFNNENFIYFQY